MIWEEERSDFLGGKECGRRNGVLEKKRSVGEGT